jgi:hypothetical protein
MADKVTVKAFTSGVHNLVTDELIPTDAASDALGWLTKDGRIELMYGRQAQGAEGAAGSVLAKHTAYKVDGTAVFFRKIWTGTVGRVQYLNGSTWTTTIDNLSNEVVTFSNYSSLSGNAVYITGPTDGLFKIMAANPGNYADVYLSTKNFKGWSSIDTGRMLMWGVKKDPTGLYGSYIDGQDSTVYTTVSGEAVGAVELGTLAFKAGGARRTCFGVAITDTSSGEVFTDNYNGVLIGSGGTNTGTINYMTGAFTITGQTGAGTATYQWEDSSALGVTDFSKSSPRSAGQGFVLRQDQGGDAIRVVIPHDGAYFSIKARSVYQYTPDPADTDPSNELIRTDIGVSTLQSAIGTSVGVVFMDTGNPTKPRVHIIQRNPVGDNFVIVPLFPHFKFENYTYDEAVLESWDKYLIISCKEESANNDRLLLCDMQDKMVDIAPYGGSCFTKASGYLYMGDPNAQTSYEMFTGFDDMGQLVNNYWISNGEKYGTDVLKKTKKYRFRGLITPDQSVSVYLSLDNGDYNLIGTMLGSGDYVDYNSTYAIGTSFIGSEPIGGDDDISVFEFLMEIKVRAPKFRKRRIKLVAEGYGYVAIQELTDFDIWQFTDRLPKQYRSKQNVSRDGTETDQPVPTY